jgi:hypothetical protein
VMYCVFIAPGNRKHLPELFKETGGKDVKHWPFSSIKIGKDGKIKIPAQLLRDYVEVGDDIDVISQLIKDDISDDFPWCRFNRYSWCFDRVW